MFEQENKRISWHANAHAHRRALAPLVAGLVVARAGLITSTYGAYRRTDQDLFTDGAMLVALALLGIVFVAIVISREHLPKRFVNRLAQASFACEAASIFALAACAAHPGWPWQTRFVLSVICAVAASLSIFYWLRRARGTNMIVAVLFVFSALAISEVELFLFSLVPAFLAIAAAGALALLQFPCLRWARRAVLPRDLDGMTQATDFFGFTKSVLSYRKFLTTTAIGIGLLSIADGLLRGYPTGASIPFDLLTRAAYGALTIVLCLVIVQLVKRGVEHVLTVGIFILIESLAFIALILYAAVPENLSVGAVATTTMNALMVGFTWYIIIAFMSSGWRDPYYYALAGWFVWLGSRAIARTAAYAPDVLSQNSMLAIAVIAALVFISSQVIMLQFMNIMRISARGETSASLFAQSGMLAPSTAHGTWEARETQIAAEAHRGMAVSDNEPGGDGDGAACTGENAEEGATPHAGTAASADRATSSSRDAHAGAPSAGTGASSGPSAQRTPGRAFLAETETAAERAGRTAQQGIASRDAHPQDALGASDLTGWAPSFRTAEGCSDESSPARRTAHEPRFAMASQQRPLGRGERLARIMGLDNDASVADVREETMRHLAERMGSRFMLSDREVEVLALYALGHTQKRVAEELFISQGTVHAHIKRIYAKTDLHSRQELIDFLQRNVD